LGVDCFWNDFFSYEKKFNFEFFQVGGLENWGALLGVSLIWVFIGDFRKDKALSLGFGLSTKTNALLFLSCGFGREVCELGQDEELNQNSRHHGAGFPLQAGPCCGNDGVECSPKRFIKF